MTPDQIKWLRFYDRGVITRYELAFLLVASTTKLPVPEFVAHLSDEVIELIRSQAGVPPEYEWNVIADYCGQGIKGWRESQCEQERLWAAGLTWWRRLFNV